MRRELLGLRWPDVDLLAGFLRVQRSVTRGKVKDVKTINSRRTLELGPEARAALEEQYATSAFTDDEHYVFPHPALGTKLDAAKLGRRYVRPAQARAGVRETFRPFHDLCVTALTYSAVVNPGYVVRAQAGHSSMQVTDRYARMATPLVLGAAAKSEALPFGKKRTKSGRNRNGPASREGKRPRLAGPFQ
jgi:integrase